MTDGPSHTDTELVPVATTSTTSAETIAMDALTLPSESATGLKVIAGYDISKLI